MTTPPRTRYRASGWTIDCQAAFLEILAEVGSVERAAVGVGRSASTAYRLRKTARGAAFAAAWDMVLEDRRARLLDELMTRANRTPKPVYYRGRVIGERVEASNRLLLSVLARSLAERRSRQDAREAAFDAAKVRLKVNESTCSATKP